MKNFVRIKWLICIAVLASTFQLHAQQKKPNIVVIFGDDIGMWNVGAYTHGMMGRTPNIDSIAKTESSSLTTTVSPVARPAAPRSSPARCPSAPA